MRGAPDCGDRFTWQDNLLHALRTRPVVILHGNVRDRYVYVDGAQHYEIGLDELLTRLCHGLYGPIRRYDAYAKASDLSLGPGDVLVDEPVGAFGAPGFTSTLDPTLAQLEPVMARRDERSVWVLTHAHNMVPYRASYPAEEAMRLVVLQRIIERIAPDNRLLLVYLSDTQVPIELSRHAHRVAFVQLALPEYAERRAFWRHRGLDAAVGEDLAKLTDGMALTSLLTLVRTARSAAGDRGLAALSPLDWERLIQRHWSGEAPDYYRQITATQLASASAFFTGQEGIQGQQRAVDKAIRMLWVARTGVDRLLRAPSSTAPRGVLFFCGPTGVGKTMLAQKIAKFVFRSEEAFLRIDMAELRESHNVSRLIGSPPGYVGFEEGGTLTTALAERPFQVVLFDEIEKAHPSVLDLFLQILSDGRLTDGRNQTVRFSEAIIIFTSNIGARAHEEDRLAEARRSGPAEVAAHFVSCVRDYFRTEISRPELLNRIGNNIVPFDFLDGDDVLLRTLGFHLRELETRFNQEYADRRLRMEIDYDAVVAVLQRTHGAAIREFGGRAAVNALQDEVSPQLARWLIAHEEAGSGRAETMRVSAAYQDGAPRIVVV